MDAVIGTQWISLSLMFLVGSIWSEDNARFGYIVTALMAAFFTWFGWLQFAYLGTVIPIIIMIAIISYLRSHLKYKYGVFGSSGGLIWKILMFAVMLQFSIVVINGMAIFNTTYAPTPDNAFTQFSLTNANDVFGGFQSGAGAVDIGAALLTNGFMLLMVVWSMLVAFFTLYPVMVTTFHVPALISMVISGGIYLLTGLEVFMLISKPSRMTEV